MASADLSRSSTSQLDEFVALNDELAALVRAGLPLELGIGSNPRHRFAARITEQLQQGRSLDEALRDQHAVIPPAYRAVIAAGLRSGRLADAVETISRTARVMVALRRRMAIASIYPAIVAVIAYALTVTLIPRMLTHIAGIMVDSHESPPALIRGLLWLLRDNPTGWLFWLPAVVLVLMWAMGGLTAVVLRLPGLNPALRSYRIAAFAELAAGLLEHGTALDEAISLAADASGDRALARDAKQVADRLRSGHPTVETLADFRSLPHFAHWMMTAGASQGTLASTLRHIADWAARRGATRADWFSLLAPAMLTLFVGGTAVVVFAALLFGPVIDLLYRLAREISM
ncbi:MAG: type II secretion system F family protein [Planctomycetaceae bacterium]